MRITAPFARSSSGRSSLAQPLRPGQFPVPVPRTVQISELFEIIEGTRSRSVFEDWAFRGTVAHITKLLLTGAHTALRSYLCNRKIRFDKNCPEISAVWNSPPTGQSRRQDSRDWQSQIVTGMLVRFPNNNFVRRRYEAGTS